jgi:hypothetical protein
VGGVMVCCPVCVGGFQSGLSLRDRLQWRQQATRFSRSLLPPFATAIRWSTVVAGWPHQTQGGLSLSMILRFRAYCLSCARVDGDRDARLWIEQPRSYGLIGL